MECRTCCEALTAFLDGELSGLERRAVEEHLAACGACQENCESLRYSEHLVGAALDEMLAPPSWGRIVPRLEPRPSWLDLRRLFGWAWQPVFLTVVVLAVLLVPGFLENGGGVEDAELEMMLSQYVRERDEMENLHYGIINTEPVGWVYYNPYADHSSSERRNPYSGE